MPIVDSLNCLKQIKSTFKINPFQKCKVKIVFQKNLKSKFYPSNKERHNLYRHFKRRATFEITHPYKFVNMLKFLCYKVQLIILAREIPYHSYISQAWIAPECPDMVMAQSM